MTECLRHTSSVWGLFYKVVRCAHLDNRFVVWAKSVSNLRYFVDYVEELGTVEGYSTDNEELAKAIFQLLEQKMLEGIAPEKS